MFDITTSKCFRLIDISETTEIYNKVLEVVNIGAPLLLPQLRERTDLLLEQLPLGSNLSHGQQMLLNIVITSLEEPAHVASLLGYNLVTEQMCYKEMLLPEKLMNTLLQTFNIYTVSHTFFQIWRPT